MEVQIRHLKGYQFEASARGHHLICDQPSENYGHDAGMSQPELFLAAIGACAAHYAVAYLSGRGLPLSDLDVRVTGSKIGHPAKIAEIGISVDAPDVDPKHHKGLLHAVESCLLHRTLLNPPLINIEVTTREPISA